ncbi:ATP-binding cassette permease mdl1, partial [Clydaea vesicula]
MSVPFSMGRIIDIIMTSLDVHTLQAPTDATTSFLSSIPLPVLFGGLAGIFVIGALANVGRLILMRISGERIVMKLKKDIFANLLKQDIQFFDKNRTGELISRLSLDTTIVGKSITNNISDGLRSFLTVSIGLSAMLYTNTKLTLIMMSIVPPVALGAIFYGKVVRNLSKKTQDALGEATKVSEEKLSQIRTVRAFNQEKSENALFASKVADIYNLAKKEAIATGIFYGGTGFSGNAVILALLYYGGGMIKDGLISVGDLTSFFLFTAYVGGSLIGLSSFYTEMMKGIGASNRIFDLLHSKTNIEDTRGKQIHPVKGLIEFHNVNFSYPTRPQNKIFYNLTFKVKPGSNVAIVGHSGSGKSSIASLLLRFYDPDSGSITIDGVDLRELDINWYRKEVAGLVSQEPILFAGTIYENIKYGKQDFDEEKEGISEENAVVYAADQANARGFIEDFPASFETSVGDKGTSVSGGQKQRIAIARALLKNP